MIVVAVENGGAYTFDPASADRAGVSEAGALTP